VIVTGAHGEEDEFLNSVFGFSTTELASGTSENLSATLQPGAAGTPFAGGPSTILSGDETNVLGSTPGTTIYAGPEGTWVFLTKVGLGKLVYLAWDPCGEADGGCGNLSSTRMIGTG
jgi:hypothetical protein